MPAISLSQCNLAFKAASLQKSIPANVANASLSPLSLSPPCGSQRAVLRCSYKGDFQTVDQSPPPFTPSELQLPSGRQSLQAQGSVEGGGKSDEADPAKVNPSEANIKDTETRQTGTAADVLSAATKAIEGMSVGQLALYGGVTAAGLFVLESVLSSLEILPLFPEAMQTIGVGYSIILASRVFQGKPVTLTPSPVKAIIELVDRGNSKVQRTNLLLPQDLDGRVSATMEKLAKERDDAVNQMEDLKKVAGNYARVIAEKEALEAVAMQLAEERDEAMSEVTALKQAVDAMADRMRAIEKMLQQELEPLKQSTRALETVALQLASERDAALKELSEVKEVVALAKCREEEKHALECLASELTQERDNALFENAKLKKIVADLQTASATASGLTPEQELFIKARIGAAGSQYMDIDRRYDEQKEEVDKLVSHLVDEYGAPRDWTAQYVKQFLDSSASRHQNVVEVNSSPSQAEIQQPT